MSETQQKPFEGQVAIVTGAGKGLGRAYARWLALNGCAVVVNNRVHPGRPSSARLLADDLSAAGGRAIAHEGAVDDRGSSTAMVETALATFGRLDIMICNAGVMPTSPFAETEAAELEQVVRINVLGTLYPLQAAWRHMIATGYGRIVLTGSTVGTYGSPGVAAYGATRAPAISLARSLTQERPEGADIGVNVVLPFAYTPMSAASMEAAMDHSTIAMIQPEQVAPVVGWLCSRGCRESGRMFHVAADRVTRVGIVESRPIKVAGDDFAHLSNAAFPLEPLFEPSGSPDSVIRLLAG